MPDFRQKNISGKRVKEARKSRVPPLTQDQLSAKLSTRGVNLDRSAIAKIEGGLRLVADFELKAISECLKVDVDWLLGSPRRL